MFKRNRKAVEDENLMELDQESRQLQVYTQSSRGLTILAYAFKRRGLYIDSQGVLHSRHATSLQHLNVIYKVQPEANELNKLLLTFVFPQSMQCSNPSQQATVTAIGRDDKKAIDAIANKLRRHTKSTVGLDSLVKYLAAFGVQLNPEGYLETSLLASKVSLFEDRV